MAGPLIHIVIELVLAVVLSLLALFFWQLVRTRRYTRRYAQEQQFLDRFIQLADAEKPFSQRAADHSVTVASQSAAAVGGIAELPAVEPGAAAAKGGSSGPDALILAALAVSGILLLSSGAWYAGRRWLR